LRRYYEIARENSIGIGKVNSSWIFGIFKSYLKVSKVK